MNIVKVILLSTILLIFNPEKKVWDESNKLEWSDFKGEVPQERGLKIANSYINIEIEGEVYKGEIPNLKIVPYFLKNESWTTVSDKITLNHEQLHFDISELYARRMRKSFDSLVYSKTVDFEIYESCYVNLYSQYLESQRLYDSETYFNEEIQMMWKDSILKELNKLNDFKMGE
ncbi:MAG: hypothetical protein Aureis2KO_32040 [Aureisphaera sp.]